MRGHSAGVPQAGLKPSVHIAKLGAREDVRRFALGYEAMKIVPYTVELFCRRLKVGYPKFAEDMVCKPSTLTNHKSEHASALTRSEASVMVHAVGAQCAAEGADLPARPRWSSRALHRTVNSWARSWARRIVHHGIGATHPAEVGGGESADCGRMGR